MVVRESVVNSDWAFSGPRARAWLSLGVLGGALALGCGRSSRKPGYVPVGQSGSGGSAGAGAGTGGSPAGGGSSGGSSGGGGSAGTGEGGEAGSPETCVPGASPVAPLRRLSRFEYDNVLRDLFGDVSRPAQRLPYDTWADLGDDAIPASDWVDGYHELAHEFALSATRSNDAVALAIGCDPSAAGEAACQAALIDTVVPRVFRRPLDAEDGEELDALFAAGREAGGTFASGVRLVLEVALQSPEFLYRSEVGEPLDVPESDPRAGWGRPAPFEMASRLSFLLWGSAPDAALLSKAASGGLRTKEQVREAAASLLEDDRSRDVLRYFHLKLLGLLDAPFPALGAAGSPELTEEIAALLRSETGAFIEHVSSLGPGGFEALLTSPLTFVNEPLAAYYGLAGVTGPDLRQVSRGAAHSGILTQGSFLAATSTARASVPSLRGFRIAKGLLCSDVAPEPSPPLPSSGPPEGLTTREHVQTQVSGPTCAGCHAQVDPLGFTLEHFDQAGRHRETEAGKPVDAAAEVTLSDGTHPVNGAPELGRLLAESSEARECYVARWAAYAYGVTPGAALDECTRASLAEAFERSNGDIRALLLELTQTDAFLYRPLTEP